MTQKAVNNAKVLYRLNISRSDVEEAHKIFTKAPFLLETLTNPVVSEEAKEVVLDKIQKQLESIYPDEKVVLSEETDASLLGGYVVRVGYEEYDHSYEGKLRRLERKLTGR